MSEWTRIDREIDGIRKAGSNCATVEDLATYTYHRCCEYQGPLFEEKATRLIAAAIRYWRPEEDGEGASPLENMMPHLRPHADQYHTDPYFRLLVDTIVPLMLEAMSLKADRESAAMERVVKDILEGRRGFSALTDPDMLEKRERERDAGEWGDLNRKEPT